MTLRLSNAHQLISSLSKDKGVFASCSSGGSSRDRPLAQSNSPQAIHIRCHSCFCRLSKIKNASTGALPVTSYRSATRSTAKACAQAKRPGSNRGSNHEFIESLGASGRHTERLEPRIWRLPRCYNSAYRGQDRSSAASPPALAGWNPTQRRWAVRKQWTTLRGISNHLGKLSKGVSAKILGGARWLRSARPVRHARPRSSAPAASVASCRRVPSKIRRAATHVAPAE